MQRSVEEIVNELDNLSNSQLVTIHNNYCEWNNYHESYIYWFNEEFLKNYKVCQAVRMATTSSHFNYEDRYIKVNYTQETFETTDYPVDDGWIDKDDLADFLLTTVAGEKLARQFDIELEVDDMEGGEED